MNKIIILFKTKIWWYKNDSIVLKLYNNQNNINKYIIFLYNFKQYIYKL